MDTKQATQDTSTLDAFATADRLINQEQVSELTSLRRTSIWRLQAAGKFPNKVDLGGTKRTVWRLSDIEAWIANLEHVPFKQAQH